MATQSWKAGSGNWSTATDWNTGTAPGLTDDVFISAPGNYVVSITASVAANSITMGDTAAVLLVNNPGGTAAIAAGVTLAGTLLVDTTPGEGGSDVSIGGVLSNNGTIGIANSSLVSSSTVSATGLNNAGVIDVLGNTAAATSNAAMLIVAGGAPAVFTGMGSLAGDALLSFGAGEIDSIAGGASLTVSGATARVADAAAPGGNSALTGLSGIAGSFALLNGATLVTAQALINIGTFTLQNSASFSAPGALANTGTLNIDAGANLGGSAFTLGGLLSNAGTVNIGNPRPSAPTTVTAAGLSNLGTLNIQGDTTVVSGTPVALNILAAAPTILSGSVNLLGLAGLTFASGGVGTIASGAQLTLNGANARVTDTGGGGALATLADNAGGFVLSNGGSVAITTSLRNTGSLAIDDHATLSVAGDITNSGTLDVDTGRDLGGDSTLAAGGTLTNTGLFEIGTEYSSGPVNAMTATAAELTNSGDIEIDGGQAAASTARAMLMIGAAAPGTLTGTINLTGDALLQFASGEIGAIATGAVLGLYGARAFVADSTDTASDSALTALATNAGAFVLENGGSLALTGGLSNTGVFSLEAGATLTVAGGIANSGALNVDTGSVGDAGGSALSIAGTLTNSGTFSIGSEYGAGLVNAATATAAGLNNSGDIEIDGGPSASSTAQATVIIGAAAPLVVTGTINMVGDSLLEFAGGGITQIASGGRLTLNGAEARVADAGATDSSSALTELNSVAGVFSLLNGQSLAVTGTLANAGTFTADANTTLTVAGDFDNTGTLDADTFILGDTGGGTLTIGGTLDNTGLVEIGSGYGAGLVASTTVAAAALNNSGTIQLTGNTTSVAQASLRIGAAAAAVLTGAFDLLGDTLLEFGSGGIATIAAGATLSLNGGKALVANASDTAHDSALTGLAAVAGTFLLQNGSAAVTSPLSITGSLGLRGATISAAAVTLSGAANVTVDATSTLSVTGAYTQNGGTSTINGALLAGTIDAAGGDLDMASVIAAGSFDIGNGGTLEFGAAVSAGATVTFADTAGTLLLDNAAAFAGTIAGAQTGDEIHIAGTAVTGVDFANGTLTVTGASGTIANLAFLGSYSTADFAFQSDGTNGSFIQLVQGTASDSIWNSSTTAAWLTAANWTGGLPGPATNAVIGTPGTYSATLTGTAAVSSLVVNQVSASAEIDPSASLAIANSVTNVGTVTVIGHGTTAAAAMSVAGDFENLGILGVDDYNFFFVSGGSTMRIGGTLTNRGTVYLGNSFQLGIQTSAPATLIAGSLVNSGKIILEGDASGPVTMDVTAGAIPSTLTSTLDVNGDALLQFSSGSVTSVAAGGSLIVSGVSAFVASGGVTNADNALTGMTSNAGNVDFDDGASITVTPFGGSFANIGTFNLIGNGSGEGLRAGTGVGANVTLAGDLVNSGILNVDTYWFFFNSGGSSLDVTGTITNTGRIGIGTSEFGGDTAPVTVTAQALVNIGTVYMDGVVGGPSTFDLTAGAAPGTVTGDIEVHDYSLLEFATGGITAVVQSSSLVVDGPAAYIADAGTTTANSALTTLTDNAGYTEIGNGATVTMTPAGGVFTNSGELSLRGRGTAAPADVTVAGDFLNTGFTDVDNYWFFYNTGGSTLTIAGTLINQGTLAIGNAPFGGSTAPVNVTAAALNNTATITIVGHATDGGTLAIAGAAPTSLNGAVNLSGVALISFGSGSVATIAAGASLTLNGTQAVIADAGSLAADGGLAGLTVNAGRFELDNGASVSATPASGAFANTGTFVLSNADFTDAGDFNNSGSVLMGAAAQTGGGTVSIAGTLSNSGAMTIGDSTQTLATTVFAAGLSDTGTLSLIGTTPTVASGPVANNQTFFPSVLDITGTAPTIFAGVLNLTGDALLAFAGGSIQTITATGVVTLNGTASVIADASDTAISGALSGLNTNDGTLSLTNGTAVSLAGNLANAGTLAVDAANSSAGGSSLNVAGTIDNSLFFALGNGNLTSGSTVTAGALTNENGATVTISAGANGPTANLVVQGTVANNGYFLMQPGGFAEAAALANTGILGLTGGALAPTSFGVIGGAANSGDITLGGFAQLGVTGALTDSGDMNVAGTLDAAGGLAVAAPGAVQLQGGNIIVSTGSLSVSAGGELYGSGSIAAPVVNNSTITSAGGPLIISGPVTGAGVLSIGAGTVLELGGAATGTVSFGGNVGTLKLDVPLSFTGTIAGLVAGDIIDLGSLQATATTVSGTTLTVTAGGQAYAFQVAGVPAGAVFALVDDQHGGTDLALGSPAPIVFGPNTQTVFVGYPSVLGPLSIADPGPGGGGTLTVTITAGSGILFGAAAGAATLGGAGSTSLTITGDLADVNAVLASVSYAGAVAGGDTVTVAVTDAGGQTAVQTIAMTTDAVPQTQPVLNAPLADLIVAGQPSGVGAISLSDPYAVATGQTVTLTVSPGALPESFAVSGGPGGTVTGQSTGSLTVTGTVPQVNSYLADGLTALILAAAAQGASNVAEKAGKKYDMYAALYDTIVALLSGNPVEAAIAMSELAGSSEVKINADFTLKQLLETANNLYGETGETAAGALASITSTILKEAGKAIVQADAFAYSFAINVVNEVVAISAGVPPLVAAAAVASGGGEGAHFLTWDGQLYQLDAEGEFLLAGATAASDSFTVEVRLEPVGNSASGSQITQVAMLVGSDRLTIGVGRASVVMLNGTAITVTAGTPDVLSGGQVSLLSPNVYQVTWNTGEVVTVTNEGAYLDVRAGLSSSAQPNSVEGLLGADSGQASDFTLPDGSVLGQPITQVELQEFANFYRIPASISLFDYAGSDSSATFDNPSFPTVPITLASLPADVVAQAATAVAAQGITDPNVAATAEFDYLVSGGDPGVIAADQSLLQGIVPVAATITPSGTPAAVAGVIATAPTVAASTTGTTSVTFEVYLTAVEAAATEIDYSVVAQNADQLGASAFGGVLPSGTVTLPAGVTEGLFTIAVPLGALGTLTSAQLDTQITTPGGTPIFASSALATVTRPVPAPPPVPQFVYLTPFGDFSRDPTDPNDYTLDLGAVQYGENLPTLQFGIENTAALPADNLGGAIAVDPVEGFTVTGTTIPAPIGAGQSYDGIQATINTVKFGDNSETITYTPQDVNVSGFSAPLTPVTVTITDTLETPGMVYSQAFGDVHILTYNQLNYDFQATGDYTLAKSSVYGDSFDIQLRLAPWYTGASVTTIQAVAISLGTDRVTFDWSRADTVEVDGSAPAGLSVGTPLILSGGTVTEISSTVFKVDWDTGETMTVSDVTPFYPGFPNFIDVVDGIPHAEPNLVSGLQGEDAGSANDFQLPDGTVLQQPITPAQLYGLYATGWGVTPANSLFGTPGPAQSAPSDPLTLADLPAAVVAPAEALVAAGGITDPGIAADAVLDYLATGDPGIIAADKNVQQNTPATVPITIASTIAPAPAIGVIATATSIVAAASGPTSVTFDAYVTSAQASATEVDYTVNVPGNGFLGAAAFGGALPSGSVTIAAGQTIAPITISVPQGALGADPSDSVQVLVSDPSGLSVFGPTAQTEIVNGTPTAGNPPVPLLAEISGGGTLTFDASTNTYTLALGGVIQDTDPLPIQLALVNGATVPGDNLGGNFTPPAGTGFTVAGNDLTAPLGPGQSYQGLYVTAKTGLTGGNTMSMMFAPTDVNDSGYSASLPAITLNITDTIAAPAQAQLNTPPTIIFPAVRTGTPESQAVSIANTAAAPAANLDVIALASGEATASGGVSELAPGATDTTDVTAGLDTSAAGARSGVVTLTPISDLGTSINSIQPVTNVDVFGSVYREGAAALSSTNLVVHVGDSGTQSLIVTNTDPNDGYSENLIATVVGFSGAVTASGSTGDIAAQQAGTLTLHFPTTAAGTAGSVTLDLKSDGNGVDGLGTVDLGQVTVPVSVTAGPVPAAAKIEKLSGAGTLTQQGAAYILNLGTITAPATVDLGVLNSASGPADALGGGFTVAAGGGFSNSGFNSFSDIAAGSVYSGPAITVSPTVTGAFSETITLAPTDLNGTTNPALTPETITVTGTAGAFNLAAAAIAPASPIDLGNVRLNGTLSQALTIANNAPALSEALDASLGPVTGAAFASGSITQLPNAQSDSSSIVVGISGAAAGVQSGNVRIDLASDGTGIDSNGTTALAPQTVTVTGTVYRDAAASILPVSEVVHVGDPGTVALTVGNTVAADGFSENLLGTLAAVTGNIGIAAAGPTGEIAAGSSDTSSLALSFSTANAGNISATATVDLTSDGGSIDGLGTEALPAQTVPVSITVDNAANPVFEDISNIGTFSGSGTAYALDLGSIVQGSGAFAVNLGVLNNTAGPADLVTGGLSAIGSAAFTNIGLAAFSGLGAGAADAAPTITLATATTGIFSETITMTPTASNSGGFSAVLPAETLTVTGTVATPPLAPAIATVTPGPSINLGNVHVGGTVSQALTIDNAATAPAAALDGTVTAVTGDATGAGAFAGLAAGASNSSAIVASIDTSGAGVRSGSVVLGFTSDSGTLGSAALPSQTIAVAGTAYREAAAALLPLTEIVHVGDPGTAALAVSNTDPSDGYSERLIALLSSTTGNIAIAASGPSPDIAAGETNTTALALAFSTAQAGTVSGTATVGLTSDGGGIDGLGSTALASQTAAVSIVVDNYADPTIGGTGGDLTGSGTNYILNLGTALQGAAPLAATLTVGNDATGPADWLNGTFAVSGASGFSNSGFAAFGTLAAGSSLGAGSVSLSTGQIGVFTETIALSAMDGNASGYAGALAGQDVTVTGTIVAPTGTASGDVHMVTFDGLHYDFQAIGDYVLTRSTVPGDSFQIQIETVADTRIAAVSVTSEAAAQIGSDTVTFSAGRDSVVWVDGAPDTALTADSPVQQLTDGQLLEISPSEFRLTWNGGESLDVTDTGAYLNTAVSLSALDGTGSVQGLLGSNSGQQNDLQLADGQVLAPPKNDSQLLGAFASSWQVSSGDLLLDTPPLEFIYTDGSDGQSVIQATAAGQVLDAAPDAGVLSDADGFGVTFSGTLADLTQQVLSGFNARDTIDLTDLNAAEAAGDYTGSATTGVLHLSDGVHSGDINLTGLIPGQFSITSDSHGGSLLTFA